MDSRQKLLASMKEYCSAPLWSSTQVAGYLGIHPKTVWDYAEAGKLKGWKACRSYRFLPEAIVDFLLQGGR